ncbi:NBS-LRR type resistance protein [Cucumis melo var. makuwa]|uniref:NBS-LRR type resistance protein n=1 Tax=Cucumis melo var. makuwa TaxID=1194695 RepID=A0A5D3DII4_CUCMM|nr:NBS-LRR type resistance protein [Cucumis melo var. makuwa]
MCFSTPSKRGEKAAKRRQAAKLLGVEVLEHKQACSEEVKFKFKFKFGHSSASPRSIGVAQIAFALENAREGHILARGKISMRLRKYESWISCYSNSKDNISKIKIFCIKVGQHPLGGINSTPKCAYYCNDPTFQTKLRGTLHKQSSSFVERTHQSRDLGGCTYQSSDPEGYTYQSGDPEGYTYQSNDPEGYTYQSSDPE